MTHAYFLDTLAICRAYSPRPRHAPHTLPRRQRSCYIIAGEDISDAEMTRERRFILSRRASPTTLLTWAAIAVIAGLPTAYAIPPPFTLYAAASSAAFHGAPLDTADFDYFGQNYNFIRQRYAYSRRYLMIVHAR